jgi:tetratricopeptide (TPR) repeat protein
MDADDYLKPEDYEKFIALKKTLDESVDGVMMLYHIAFDASGRPTFSYYRERLVKRSRNYRWEEPVHEYISTPGAHTINADIAITHAKQGGGGIPGRNMRIYEARVKEGKPLSTRGLYYYARELRDNGRYADAIDYFERFLETRLGWVEDNIGACLALSDCYAEEKKPEQSLLALLRSFQYDLPRGEICTRIGYHFKGLNQTKLAVYWFEAILQLEYPSESWGFLQKDHWGYIPCLELCVCYDKLGNREKAIEYNEKAAAYKPDSAAVRDNREYFGIPVD